MIALYIVLWLLCGFLSIAYCIYEDGNVLVSDLPIFFGMIILGPIYLLFVAIHITRKSDIILWERKGNDES